MKRGDLEAHLLSRFESDACTPRMLAHSRAHREQARAAVDHGGRGDI
jgi:hypothetical protein